MALAGVVMVRRLTVAAHPLQQAFNKLVKHELRQSFKEKEARQSIRQAALHSSAKGKKKRQVLLSLSCLGAAAEL